MAEEVKIVSADEFMEQDGTPKPQPKQLERRVVSLWLDEEMIFRVAISILTNETFQFRHILEFANVPRDVEVVRVCHDVMRRQFGFLLSHPSFVPIPEGMPAPNLLPLGGKWSVKAISQVSEAKLRSAIHEALDQIGCVRGGSCHDNQRWTRTDLATDLAPVVEKLLGVK